MTTRLEVKGMTDKDKKKFKVQCAKEGVTYAGWIVKRL